MEKVGRSAAALALKRNGNCAVTPDGLAELCRQNLTGGSRVRQRFDTQRFVHRGIQQIATTRIKATDHNSLRVEQIDDDGQRFAQASSRDVHDFECEGFTRFRCVRDLSRRNMSVFRIPRRQGLRPVSTVEQRAVRCRRRCRILQTILLYRTPRVRLPRAEDDPPRQRRRWRLRRGVRSGSHRHPYPDFYRRAENHMLATASGSELPFRERAGIRIVHEPRVAAAQRRTQFRADRHAVPVGR